MLIPSLYYRSPMIAIQLSEKGVDDIQLFRTGTFYHEKYGKFDITPQILLSMEKNFKNNVRGVDVAIDYKHENDDIAAGWVKDVYLKNDTELWAKVDWTPTGAKVLAEKEFRYISPEFIFNYQDNESLQKFGPVLLGAGLTNRPTIKKMEPVVLSEVSTKYKEKDKKNMTLEQVDQMSIEELKALCKKLIAEAQPEDEKPADASPSDSPEMTEMKKKLAASEKQLADMNQAKACSEKKAQFDLLLTEGKACKAQEKAYLDGDMSKFVALASPLKLHSAEVGSGGVVADSPTVETREQAEDEVMKLAAVKRKDNSALSLSDAFKSVLIENPELNQKLYGR